MRWLYFAVVGFLLCPSLLAEPAGEEKPSLEPAPLVIWNREVAVFRAPIANLTPLQRRDATRARVKSLSDAMLYEEVTANVATLGNLRGVSFMLGESHLFTLVEGDLDPSAGESLEQIGKEVLATLEEIRLAKLNQRNIPFLFRGIGISVAATAAFVLLIWVLRWLSRKLRQFVIQRAARMKKFKVRDFDFRPVMLQAFRRVLALIGWAVAFFGAYVWIGTVLAQFPYTAPWGRILGDRLGLLVAGMLERFVHAIPGVAGVVVIFVITRWVARLADRFFRQFEFRHDNSSWLGQDMARASRRIVVVLIWIFGLTIAYPYIPGSESPAFKGISVLVGLMISLGSTGLVNQVMSGFVVLYSGAVRTGEYARVGDTEGTIEEIGLLSTKVFTPRREYVTVPNAVLISKETLNYSRMEENDKRTEIFTSVTIGYDTPWRQVHAMLLLAAERTPGIRKQPEPRVIQTALSDFYVEYELRVVPSKVALKGVLLSDLHQRIQDVFNEFEVQIMSPNFRSQPEQNIISPKDQWFAAPAKVPEGKDKKS